MKTICMVSLAFPRELRLLTPGDFNYVFQQAQRVSSPHFTILGRNNSLGSPRLGLTIAKKHVKLAHERNRIKRLVRESFRLSQHKLLSMDFVVLARPGLAQLDNRQLTDTLDKLWYRYSRSAPRC